MFDLELGRQENNPNNSTAPSNSTTPKAKESKAGKKPKQWPNRNMNFRAAKKPHWYMQPKRPQANKKAHFGNNMGIIGPQSGKTNAQTKDNIQTKNNEIDLVAGQKYKQRLKDVIKDRIKWTDQELKNVGDDATRLIKKVDVLSNELRFKNLELVKSKNLNNQLIFQTYKAENYTNGLNYNINKLDNKNLQLRNGNIRQGNSIYK